MTAIRTIAAALSAAVLSACGSTQVVQHGNKASMTSIRTPDALIDCVHSNAKDMNNIMIGLILKRATTADGHPRLVVDRVLNTFAVVDAEPVSGGGSRATVHFGVAGIAPDYYLRQLTQGCA